MKQACCLHAPHSHAMIAQLDDDKQNQMCVTATQSYLSE